MKLLYTIKKESLILLMIFGGFLFLMFQPHLRSVLLPPYRNLIKKEFVDLTVRQKQIDPQQFWILREYYYPNQLSFRRFGFNKNDYQAMYSRALFVIPSDTLVFLIGQSKFSKSIEALINVDRRKIDSFLLADEDKEIIFKGDNELIFKKNGAMYIIFIKPISQMLRANAYYDARGDDSELLANKTWLVIAEFK